MRGRSFGRALAGLRVAHLRGMVARRVPAIPALTF